MIFAPGVTRNHQGRSSIVKVSKASRNRASNPGSTAASCRKRHTVVDIIGYLIVAVVYSAGINDGKAANTIRKIWADSAYIGREFHDLRCRSAA